MRMCPFWSTDDEQISCNKECPMVQDLERHEECVFKEYLDSSDLKFIEL